MKSPSRSWILLAVVASVLLLVSSARALRTESSPLRCAIAAEATTGAAAGTAAPATFEGDPTARGATPTEPTDAQTPLSELERALSNASEAELQVLTNRIASRGGEDAVRSLARFADSPRATLRDAALGAIGKLDSEPARVFMLSALRGVNVRAGVEYFKNCMDARAVESLERLARESAPELSASTVEALVAQGSNAYPSLVRLAQSDSDAEPAVFSTAGNLPSLRPALRNVAIARLARGMRVPNEIMSFLAGDRSSQALSALTAAASEPALTELAVQALTERGDPDSSAALLTLRRARPEVSCEATHVLLSQPDSRSLGVLSRLGDSRSSSQVTQALLQIGAPEGSRSLLALLRSREPNERSAAVRMLVQFGPTDAQARLAELLDDPSPSVRYDSGTALRQLGVEVAGMPVLSFRVPH